MVDKDKNNNQSDWLNKIKEQAGVSEDDQKQTILDEDENEIEIEIKDKGEEKEETVIESEKKKESEKKEEIKEQPPEDKAPEHKEEPEVQVAEEKEKILSDHGQPVADESIITVSASLPKNIYAHFLLIDIDAPVREIRGVPRYIPISNTRTLIGRYAKAHVHLDDLATIEIKHAKLVFEDKNGNRDFFIYPINNAIVSVNRKSLSDEGIILKSGDLVEIGSADLIFFHCDLEGDNQ